LQAYALQAAALLKADRNAAIAWRGRRHAGRCDRPLDTVRATADMIRIPEDVRFDALLPQTCNRHEVLSTSVSLPAECRVRGHRADAT